MSALPVAVVMQIIPARTTRTVVVSCPFCHQSHRHGWPFSQLSIGPRVAHCTTGPMRGTTYMIETPT
jgi:hypothetical protein